MSPILAPVPKPPVDFDQEIRFAVVMYGGSSLAIYINGVAQELLRLVRATAPEFSGAAHGRQAHLADEELRGSERVYRRLGRILNRQGDLDEAHSDAANPGPIRTRFVVDILTGTSAGGINAVYLAKALANNQDMDELKNLWITEGDIGVLINDADSSKDLGFTLPRDKGEPWSLLNSRRMYVKLLDALRGMDAAKQACAPGTSPLVDELDLFVTATDVSGRVVQLRLADDVVPEYRHRNVFRFRYRSLRASDINHNDFDPEYNAFLAFVARATSAHQAAFSPVKLGDVGSITKKYPQTYPPRDEQGKPRDEYSAEHEKLRAFYRDYLLQRATNPNGEATETNYEALVNAFQKVWFVDGGTLDNKPFSFVAEELPLRNADTFVDRKLLYIEPSPEQSEWRRAPEKRPQIVGNAVAGLSSLPRYETIVEDLTRLLERNRLVERLGHLMREMEGDLIDMPPQPPRGRDKFLELLKDRTELEKWLQSKGPSWGSYQRLRAAEVTDDMALLVTRAAGFSEDSEEFIAIRYLVRAWRTSKYDSRMEDGKASIIEFLVEFDLMWSMRRIRFVLKKLNDLACLDEGDKDARRIAGVPRGQKESDVWPAKEAMEEFRMALRNIRSQLNSAYVELRGERRILWATDETNPFRRVIRTLDIGSSDLLELMREPTDEDRGKKAKELLGKPLGEKAAALLRELAENSLAGAQSLTRSDAIEELTKRVREMLGKATNEARDSCSEALRPPNEDANAVALSRWDRFLRKTLWYYYVHFDSFDQISYPILYSTGVGEEADVIDVFRVSPRDAIDLINEREDKVQKLAGTTLGNFGAFFERKFRINDIMWGRLDGAERVIAALLPTNPTLKEELTREAHHEIIREEATNRMELARAEANKVFGSMPQGRRAKDNLSMMKQVEESLKLMASNQDCESQLDTINREASRLPGDSPWRVFLESFVSEFRPFVREYIVPTTRGVDPIEAFKNWFRAQYQEGRTFTESATLSSAVRINRVLGDMALGYFPSEGKRSRWERLKIWLGFLKPNENERGRVQMLLVLFGRNLLMSIEAAIQPDGAARRKQRERLAAAYLLSLMIVAFVCLPAFLLLLSPTKPLPILALVLILLVTFLLALIPLLLTAGYNLVWFKLRGKLEGFLLGSRRN